MTISMLSNFYRRYSVPLLWAIAFSFPYFTYYAETIKTNNDLETWLPKDTPARMAYEDFKKEFGVEEVIVVGLNNSTSDDRLIEAIAGRLDHARGIEKCWTPERLKSFMERMGVSDEVAEKRLNGLTQMEGGGVNGNYCRTLRRWHQKSGGNGQCCQIRTILLPDPRPGCLPDGYSCRRNRTGPSR